MSGRAPLWNWIRRQTALGPLALALLVGSVFALVEPVPIDMALRQARYALLAKEASGHIVVIEQADDVPRSVESERRRDARLLNALHGYRPEQVFVEHQYATTNTPDADAALAAALDRFGPSVVLAAKFTSLRQSDRTGVELPAPPFLRRAKIGSTGIRINPFGYTERMTYGNQAEGRRVPSFASLMADRPGPIDQMFLIDFSTRLGTVPHISAEQVLSGAAARAALAGKVVVIAASSAANDNVRLPRLGISPQTDAHVLAAETLLRGQPADLGGWPLLLLVGAGHWLIGRGCPSRRRATALRAVGFAALPAAGVVASLFQVNLDAGPALVALATVTWITIWRARKLRVEQTNARSNLPNMAGFRATAVPPDSAVVVARVARIDEILTALPARLHGEFARAMVHRLKTGNDDLVLYHDENGHFAWHGRAQSFASIESHLTGLKAMFATPIALDGHSIDVELAFGVDVNSDQEPALRLASASNAAAEAEASGQVAHSFDSERLERASWTTSLHTAIDRALQNQEIWVAYQAKLDLASGRVTGAEALVRWTHPTRGNISPAEFIAHAERDGRIDALTWAVADHAVASAALLNTGGPPFHVAINLSAVMLGRQDLHDRLMATLFRHKLRPDLLTLELTETVPLAENPTVMANLHRLRASGCRVSIDDYGTGASNLLYLKTVPSDEVKIDQVFVTGLTDSAVNTAIVRGTIDMVHALGRCVVAEGVEDLATLRLLGQLGCDVAQGFAIGRPQSIDRFQALFRSGSEARYSSVKRNQS